MEPPQNLIFVNKIKFSLKEMRESNYWIRIITEINKRDDELNFLLKESNELKKILGAISTKATK
ncbi:MAG: four helix bundle protein [Ignavibacteriales bacterium]|nr:four helix bundle protein [Ignavibacteriales bacterium]